MAGLVPAITDGYAFSFQTRFTNLVDQLVWNAFASNSDRLQALLFGNATHRGVEPLVRSGHTSTDAKVVTAIHAIAAALPFFLPEAAGAFCAAPAPCFLLRPTICYNQIHPNIIKTLKQILNSAYAPVCPGVKESDSPIHGQTGLC